MLGAKLIRRVWNRARAAGARGCAVRGPGSVEINERMRLVAADVARRDPRLLPDGVRRVLDLLRRRFNYGHGHANARHAG